MKGAEVPEGPSGCKSPTPGPSPFVCNQRAGSSMTRAQLCSALNRFCYRSALPRPFFQGVPAQSRGAVLTQPLGSPSTHPPLEAGRRVTMVGGTSLLSSQMQRAGARGLELRDVLPGRPPAPGVPPPGSASAAQHLGTIGRLREVESGGTTVLLLRGRQVRSERGRASGTHFSIPPTPGAGAHPPVCAAWLGRWRRPPAGSRCSRQSHHRSCGCRKPQVQTARPPRAGPAPDSSPRSHPCRGQRRGRA